MRTLACIMHWTLHHCDYSLTQWDIGRVNKGQQNVVLFFSYDVIMI